MAYPPTEIVKAALRHLSTHNHWLIGPMRSIQTDSNVRCWPIDVIDLLLRFSPNDAAAAHFWNSLQLGDPNIGNFVHSINMLVQYLINTTAWRAAATDWCQTFYDDLLIAYCTNRPRLTAPTVALHVVGRPRGISTRLVERDGPRCLISNAFSDLAPTDQVPVHAAVVGSQVAHVVPYKMHYNFDFQIAAADWAGIAPNHFGGNNINSVSNQILIHSELHLALDQRLWGFEWVNGNTYRVRFLEPLPGKYSMSRHKDGILVRFCTGLNAGLYPPPTGLQWPLTLRSNGCGHLRAFFSVPMRFRVPRDCSFFFFLPFFS